MRQLLSLRRKCVVCKLNGVHMRRIPVAFVQNMQAWRVQRMIEQGMFVYKPKSQKPQRTAA
jgi:hypothetical protein